MAISSDESERALGLRVTRLLALLAVQVFPLLALAAVYPAVAVPLHTTVVGGQTVATLMVTAAVLAPLLAQTVSAPIYRLIDGVDRNDRWRVGAMSLRAVPRGLLIGVPVALGAALLVAHSLGWSLLATGALAGVVELHLLLSALLVASYATGGKISLLATWSAYALGLLAAPTQVWVPAAAAVATQGSVLVVASIRSRGNHIGAVPPGVLASAVTRGIADVLPLWSIPLALLAVDPRHFLAGPVFIGMLPAIVTYHVYFETTAEPMWRSIDRTRRLMGALPYQELADDLRGLRISARRGLVRVLVVETIVGLTAALIIGAAKWDGVPVFLGVLVVSGAGVIMLAQVYTYGMLHPGLPVAVSGVVLAPAIIIGVATRIGGGGMLITLGVTYAAVGLLIALLNDRAWRLPEYALFWRAALSA